MVQLQGIFPALCTPFDARDKINLPVLCDLVEMNLAKGVDGFYVNGSTGEAFLMSVDERKATLEAVVRQVAGRAKIIAHIGTIATDTAIALARHAKEAGADAISSIPPFYYGFTFEEIHGYYRDIVDAVDMPMILYNFPANSGVRLTLDNIRAFLDDPRFIGVKHTSNDFYMLERIKAQYPGAVVYNGYDEMFLSGLSAGADGGIGSTYNVMAEKFVQMRALFAQGRLQEAQRLQQQANAIIAALIRVGVLPGEKALLEALGLPFGPCRKPFRALTAQETEWLVGIFKDNQ